MVLCPPNVPQMLSLMWVVPQLPGCGVGAGLQALGLGNSRSLSARTHWLPVQVRLHLCPPQHGGRVPGGTSDQVAYAWSGDNLCCPFWPGTYACLLSNQRRPWEPLEPLLLVWGLPGVRSPPWPPPPVTRACHPSFLVAAPSQQELLKDKGGPQATRDSDPGELNAVSQRLSSPTAPGSGPGFPSRDQGSRSRRWALAERWASRACSLACGQLPLSGPSSQAGVFRNPSPTPPAPPYPSLNTGRGKLSSPGWWSSLGWGLSP